MKTGWWKLLAVLLLLIASIAALWVPLAPDLVHVTPDRIDAGPVELTVTGYNTRFSEVDLVAIENDGQRLCAIGMDLLDDTHLKARFMVPIGLRADLSDLIVGDLRYKGALFTQSKGSGIQSQACPPGSLTKTTPPAASRFEFPNRSILYESIRNLCFHVPMWFAMIVLMAISVVYSIRVLGSNSLEQDQAALSAVRVGLLFCSLGLITGALWARATWGAVWTNDVKLNGAAVTALIYLAYLVLRGSVPDPHKRARLAAIYNIFAFVLLVLFLFVVPRLNAIDSLHPGNGGNSGFNDLDLDNRLRVVFYPAVLGWVLLGTWMFNLHYRRSRLALRNDPWNA